MNPTPKPEYIFVIENKIGGVAYLNKNIVNNTTLRENVIVKVILVDQTDSNHPRFPDKIDADEIIDFPYSTKENKYAVLQRFHALLGNTPGAVICNDGLEMEALYLLGTAKTVYQIVHDYYNITLAFKFGAITDVFVTHTSLFRDVLLSADPVSVKSFWLHHGVPIPDLKPAGKSPGQKLKAIFVGRLVEAKGVQKLFVIDSKLRSMGIDVEWTIIGRGPLKDALIDQWKDRQNITFSSPDTNQQVMEIMTHNDLFILPTHFEGSPVTVLEALSCGLVPVVSDLPGGINEIVTNDIGRKIPIDDTTAFADAIAFFNGNRTALAEMSANGRKLAEEKFDILQTSNNYFALFGRFASLKKETTARPPIKIGFRLDQKWLPNTIVRFLRRG